MPEENKVERSAEEIAEMLSETSSCEDCRFFDDCYEKSPSCCYDTWFNWVTTKGDK